jgi:hypothetical protein
MSSSGKRRRTGLLTTLRILDGDGEWDAGFVPARKPERRRSARRAGGGEEPPGQRGSGPTPPSTAGTDVVPATPEDDELQLGAAGASLGPVQWDQHQPAATTSTPPAPTLAWAAVVAAAATTAARREQPAHASGAAPTPVDDSAADQGASVVPSTPLEDDHKQEPQLQQLQQLQQQLASRHHAEFAFPKAAGGAVTPKMKPAPPQPAAAARAIADAPPAQGGVHQGSDLEPLAPLPALHISSQEHQQPADDPEQLPPSRQQQQQQPTKQQELQEQEREQRWRRHQQRQQEKEQKQLHQLLGRGAPQQADRSTAAAAVAPAPAPLQQPPPVVAPPAAAGPSTSGCQVSTSSGDAAGSGGGSGRRSDRHRHRGGARQDAHHAPLPLQPGGTGSGAGAQRPMAQLVFRPVEKTAGAGGGGGASGSGDGAGGGGGDAAVRAAAVLDMGGSPAKPPGPGIASARDVLDQDIAAGRSPAKRPLPAPQPLVLPRPLPQLQPPAAPPLAQPPPLMQQQRLQQPGHPAPPPQRQPQQQQQQQQQHYHQQQHHHQQQQWHQQQAPGAQRQVLQARAHTLPLPQPAAATAATTAADTAMREAAAQLPPASAPPPLAAAPSAPPALAAAPAAREQPPAAAAAAAAAPNPTAGPAALSHQAAANPMDLDDSSDDEGGGDTGAAAGGGGVTPGSVVRRMLHVNASQAEGAGAGAAPSLELAAYLDDEDLVAGFLRGAEWKLYPWQVRTGPVLCCVCCVVPCGAVCSVLCGVLTVAEHRPAPSFFTGRGPEHEGRAARPQPGLLGAHQRREEPGRRDPGDPAADTDGAHGAGERGMHAGMRACSQGWLDFKHGDRHPVPCTMSEPPQRSTPHCSKPRQVVLPYRALCEQKVEHFRRVLQGRWDVKELYGQHGRLEFDQTTGEGVPVEVLCMMHGLLALACMQTQCPMHARMQPHACTMQPQRPCMMAAPQPPPPRLFPSRPCAHRVAPARPGVVVCTIEKAHALVQKMLEEEQLHNLGCVVVDELHMVRCGCMGGADGIAWSQDQPTQTQPYSIYQSNPTRNWTKTSGRRRAPRQPAGVHADQDPLQDRDPPGADRGQPAAGHRRHHAGRTRRRPSCRSRARKRREEPSWKPGGRGRQLAADVDAGGGGALWVRPAGGWGPLVCSWGVGWGALHPCLTDAPPSRPTHKPAHPSIHPTNQPLRSRSSACRPPFPTCRSWRGGWTPPCTRRTSGRYPWTFTSR